MFSLRACLRFSPCFLSHYAPQAFFAPETSLVEVGHLALVALSSSVNCTGMNWPWYRHPAFWCSHGRFDRRLGEYIWDSLLSLTLLAQLDFLTILELFSAISLLLHRSPTLHLVPSSPHRASRTFLFVNSSLAFIVSLQASFSLFAYRAQTSPRALRSCVLSIHALRFSVSLRVLSCHVAYHAPVFTSIRVLHSTSVLTRAALWYV